MSLINIAKDDVKPFFVEASDITGLQFHENQGDPALSLYNAKGAVIRFAPMALWNIDASTVVEKLRAAGASLVGFPTRWPKDDDTFKEYPQYINPGAVTYATVTAVNEKGHLGAIVGVTGMGRLESYNNTPAEWQTLLAAVKAAKTLREYKPEEASSRWYNAAGLYIDPKAVTRIVDDGFYQVNIYFEKRDSLDIQFPSIDVNDVFQEMPKLQVVNESSLREAFNEARRRKEQIEKTARTTFANELAAANGTLINIPSPVAAIHISKNDIGYVYLDDSRNGEDKIIFINPQQTAEDRYSPEAVRVYLRTDEEAQKAMKTLIDAQKPAQAALKKKPRGNAPKA